MNIKRVFSCFYVVLKKLKFLILDISILFRINWICFKPKTQAPEGTCGRMNMSGRYRPTQLNNIIVKKTLFARRESY
jgi:hypothetical protein